MEACRCLFKVLSEEPDRYPKGRTSSCMLETHPTYLYFAFNANLSSHYNPWFILYQSFFMIWQSSSL